jgi:hypothetical protein
MRSRFVVMNVEISNPREEKQVDRRQEAKHLREEADM